MILSFSKNYPWRDKKSQLIPTNFKTKLWQKSKIHTFRLGYRWREGQTVHAYENNPRNGGQKFGINGEYGKDKCYKIENWEMEIHYETAAVMVICHIEGVCMFNAKLTVGGEVLPYSGEHKIVLEMIAKNDGLTAANFLRWFIHSAKGTNGKLEGQIVHLIPNFAYVTDLNASITDSQPTVKDSIEENDGFCTECMQNTPFEELEMFGGMCEYCTEIL